MAKDLQGITVSLVPAPKTSLSAPEVGTVFLPGTKTLCSAEFSSSIALTRGMLYTSSKNAVFHVS